MTDMRSFLKSIANLPEEGIREVAGFCQTRLQALAIVKQHRREWVDAHYRAYLRNPNTTCKQLGPLTIVALYNRDTGNHIGAATCLPEDDYDEMVGIAVAFAKANGESVPKYI